MSNLTKLFILLFIGLFLAAASIWLIGGKKKEYDFIATLKARPYQLFPYLVEPEQKKRWMTGLIEEAVVIADNDESEDAGALKENAKLQTVIDVDGEPISFEGQVLRFQKNEIASFKYRSEEMNRTSFFRLKGKDDLTQLEYRRIVKLDGFKRFTSVFGDDANQQDVEAEIKRLTEIVEKEVDNSIPNPEPNLATVGVESENKDAESLGNASETSQTPDDDSGSDN